MTTNETIQHLLNIMLNTILNNAPYPGQDIQQSFFPDIELMQDDAEIIVSGEDLDPSYCFEVPGYKICVVPQEELPSRVEEKGDFPYLSLTEIQISGDNAILSLQLKWAISEVSQQSGKFYFGGGGVRVRFVLQDGEWVSPTGPMATWMS